MKKILFILIIFIAALSLNSCYYDKYDELSAYKALTQPCDSANVAFASSVAPIFTSYCVSCHSSSLASGGYDFSNYSGIMKAVNNNRLLGSIEHLSGYQPMPSGTKLNACNLKIIENWVNSGARNN